MNPFGPADRRTAVVRPAGDPARAAGIIVQTAHRADVPLHLLLGVNAVEMSLDYSRQQLAEATAWEKVSRSADFAEPYPVDPPRTRDREPRATAP